MILTRPYSLVAPSSPCPAPPLWPSSTMIVAALISFSYFHSPNLSSVSSSSAPHIANATSAAWRAYPLVTVLCWPAYRVSFVGQGTMSARPEVTQSLLSIPAQALPHAFHARHSRVPSAAHWHVGVFPLIFRLFLVLVARRRISSVLSSSFIFAPLLLAPSPSKPFLAHGSRTAPSLLGVAAFDLPVADLPLKLFLMIFLPLPRSASPFLPPFASLAASPFLALCGPSTVILPPSLRPPPFARTSFEFVPLSVLISSVQMKMRLMTFSSGTSSPPCRSEQNARKRRRRRRRNAHEICARCVPPRPVPFTSLCFPFSISFIGSAFAVGLASGVLVFVLALCGRRERIRYRAVPGMHLHRGMCDLPR
ncbi:hypothetical protein B0H13DRAFT_2355015 [Mycena leptocephala]|nr:hypothetical protein B0H13DRAFT_2355015 [Mycena leptocephala]